ncbi:MAG: hypothetical protein KME64_44005 [Scytonematopsis contorta HA4267-MV1]|jgi:hypothetical protein|nr:hypothetical protein [Scytonematopsis contorta HA4267-MV1]
MKTGLVYPLGYRVIRRGVKDSELLWFFQRVEVLFNPTNFFVSDKISDIEGMFGTTKESVVTELFKINGGRLGYYLANLVDKEYHYCGENIEDVKAKFVELGVAK